MDTHFIPAAAVAVRRWFILGPTLVLILFLGACGATPPSAARPGVADSTLARSMTVYRSPDCSCCHAWVDLARSAGWTVAVVDKIDLASFKADHGVPVEAASCHTAIIGPYVVEGHVPFEAVDRLLSDRPDIDGIAVPGMPAGSPGMGGVSEGPIEVVAIRDGEVRPFGS